MQTTRNDFLFCHVLHSKCPKILYIKMSNKMAYANIADPDQTVPEGAI